MKSHYLKQILQGSVLIFFLILSFATIAQTGIGTTTPEASAQLDVSATNKGFLPPRLTQTQRNAIASPVAGLMIYQTDNNPGIYLHNGTAWVSMASASTLKFGDVKYGFQTANHDGWILLDGRLRSLLTATQQTNATAALGTGTNLPDARERYLSYSTSSGPLFGSNSFNIGVGNLPTNTFSGTTATLNGGASGAAVGNGAFGLTRRSNGGSNTTTSTDTSPGELNIIEAPIDHAHNFNLQLNTGSQTAINNRPASLNVRVFIYLGE